jgi:hypothetical protein
VRPRSTPPVSHSANGSTTCWSKWRADGARSDDLRQMITQTGIFAQFAATADSLVRHADRVSQHYQDLIDAVKDAFDERRVREGDALQKAGAILALSPAFDSIVSIMSVIEPQATGRQDTWLPVLAYSSGALVLVTSLAFIVWIMRLGRLGGRVFRTRYDGTRSRTLATMLGAIGTVVGIRSRRRDTRKDGLWRFMKNSSTDALEGHLRRHSDQDFWHRLGRRTLTNNDDRQWATNSQVAGPVHSLCRVRLGAVSLQRQVRPDGCRTAIRDYVDPRPKLRTHLATEDTLLSGLDGWRRAPLLCV